MNLLEVGALLKRERERCGVSIRDVMDATKISRRNLTALEEGQLKALPHPVYLKGYVRNIAKMVGLDADELAHMVDAQYDSETGRYLAQTPAAAPVDSAATTPGASPSGDRAAAHSAAGHSTMDAASPHLAQQQPASAEHSEPERENRPRFAAVSLSSSKPKASGTRLSVAALLLLLAALVWLLVRFQDNAAEVPPPPPPAPVAQPMAASLNATAEDNASESLDNASAEVALASETARADMPAAAPAKLPPRDPGLAALGPSSLGSDPVSGPAPESASARQSVPASSIEVTRKAPAAELRTPGMQQLTISAKPDEVCWVHVSDGQQSRSFTLRNGETHHVEFSSRVRVRLGNAGGVSFRLNGREYPYDGKRGSIDTVEFGAR
jgi:cytoskeleton protein RodZ